MCLTVDTARANRRIESGVASYSSPTEKSPHARSRASRFRRVATSRLEPARRSILTYALLVNFIGRRFRNSLVESIGRIGRNGAAIFAGSSAAGSFITARAKCNPLRVALDNASPRRCNFRVFCRVSMRVYIERRLNYRLSIIGITSAFYANTPARAVSPLVVVVVVIAATYGDDPGARAYIYTQTRACVYSLAFPYRRALECTFVARRGRTRWKTQVDRARASGVTADAFYRPGNTSKSRIVTGPRLEPLFSRPAGLNGVPIGSCGRGNTAGPRGGR